MTKMKITNGWGCEKVESINISSQIFRDKNEILNFLRFINDWKTFTANTPEM